LVEPCDRPACRRVPSIAHAGHNVDRPRHGGYIPGELACRAGFHRLKGHRQTGRRSPRHGPPYRVGPRALGIAAPLGTPYARANPRPQDLDCRRGRRHLGGCDVDMLARGASGMAAALSLAEAMNIVFFKVSPIGDTVMFLPVVQALRRLRPKWTLTVVTTPLCAELFSPSIGKGNVIALERQALRRCWRRPLLFVSLLRRLRNLRPDAAMLSFDQSSMARILGVASGAQLRIGGAGSAVRWNRGITREVKIMEGHSLAQWDWEMARALLSGTDVQWTESPPPPEVGVPATGRPRARPRILVHAGASRDYQRWPAQRFADLAAKLASDFDVVWVQAPEASWTKPAPGVEVAPSQSLGDFMRLASSADLFVGNHSGPLHLASAMGLACVVPTGPTLPACDPFWHRDRVVLLRRQGLSCMPCDHLIASPNRCLNSQSPMACLDYWSVEAVERACREAIDRARAAQRTGMDRPR